MMRSARFLAGAPAGRGGFTLLEILLVLALIALVGGALAGGSARLLADRPVTVEGLFWEVVGEVRKDALLHQHDVQLRYDPETRALVANLWDGPRVFPLPPGEAQLDFLPPVQRSNRFVLIGGLLVETDPLTQVTFFDDGTCLPFRVQIRTGAEAQLLEIDPWTCAPVLRQET